MSDDIVTHLRLKSASQIDVVTRLEKKCVCCPCCEEFCLYCETVGEFADVADEIERLRQENRIMADLLWHFMENTDENLTANLSILHRAAKKLAIKGED